MIALDEDMLICDLAETYHVYNYREHPLSLVATLAAGLRENSRIRMKMSRQPAPSDTVLLAKAVDYLAFLSWTKTRDAEKGRNYPKSIVAEMFGEKEETEIIGYEDAESFLMARYGVKNLGELNGN